MSLRDRTGEKADLYRRAGQSDAAAGHLLVPLAELESALAARGGNGEIGVEIDNTARAEALAPYLDRLGLIAIAFPAFGDGRGFSIAKSLRNRGYRGVLRAVGPLIADQFAYALACGFDEVELPAAVAARQPVAQWIAALGAMRGAYQRSHPTQGIGILEQRRAARRARPE
ncbi:MAG: DUF934 domain-containing protein [Rhizobiales bacterium]|nr:DUF934 domain-containing protein [Hyphomicrobiales bacterium]